MPKAQPIPLLPCPWCGSEEVQLFDSNLNRDSMDLDPNYEAVICLECESMGPCTYQNEAKAIADWNKGPYADRFEVHALALQNHANKLESQAREFERKAAELRSKIGGKGS